MCFLRVKRCVKLTDDKLIPFTKWTGGKRQLLVELNQNLPKKFNTYYEPFIGGGALFFDLAPKNAVINDLNSDLMMCYLAIRDNVEELIDVLNIHAKNNSKEYYLSVRAADRDEKYDKMSEVEKAARMMYMLRVNYNGMYRVNSKGQFNVPYGRYKNPNIVNEELLYKINKYLNVSNVEILNTRFEHAVSHAKEGDFVYFDPPYIPVSATSSFTSYTKDGFTLKDQEMLRDVFVELDKKGVYVMLSNSSNPLVFELYKDYVNTTIIVGATRMINSDASKRGKVQEVLIKNY